MADPKPPYDDGRELRSLIEGLRRRVEELEVATGTQQNLAVGSAVVDDADSTSTSGFGLSANWVTYATVTIPVPAGRSVARIVAFGTAAALDTATGGLTTISGRIVIAGLDGLPTPASKDAGASQVNNIVYVQMQRTITPAPTAITVELQMNPLNPSAFPPQPQNQAQLTALAFFSNP